MDRRPSKLALGIMTFCVSASAFAAGCMNPGPTPGGGPEAGGGGQGGAGGSSSAGTGGLGGTSQPDAAPDGKPLNCPTTKVANAGVTGFSDWDPVTGNWGTAPGLTGTTFLYPISAPPTATLVPADTVDAGGNMEAASDTGAAGDTGEGGDTGAAGETDAAADTDAGSETDVANDAVAAEAGAGPVTTHLRVTARIAAGRIAGIGFDFTPVCTDVSQYRGISFTMFGKTGGAQPVMLVKTDDDAPMSGGKGHCPGTIGAGCVLPSKTFDVPDMPSPPTILSFGGFLGGQPTMTVDSRTLLGVEWQFECPLLDGAPDCVVDVALDDVQFVVSVPQE